MRARHAALLIAGFSLSTGACSAILNLQPPTEPEPDAGPDGTTGGDTGAGDTSTREVGPDSGDAGVDALICAPVDASVLLEGGDAPTVWNALDNPVLDEAGTHAWSVFDTSTVVPSAANFQGAAFDGRYVYLAPLAGSTVTRYDTQGSFTQRASWSTFDTSTLPVPAGDFSGAVFDGRYVTFVPGGTAKYAGIVARYDTGTGGFASASAWSTFDTLSLPASDGGALAEGFRGGVFDGRYLYLVPYVSGATRDGHVVRYDTLVPEGGAADAGGLDAADAGDPDSADAEGPDAHDAGMPDAQDAGADAHPSDAGADAHDAGPSDATFDAPADTGSAVPPQWASFDTATQNASAVGFFGGVFDGRYVYFAPFDNAGPINDGYSGWVGRYDTHGSFTTLGSWAAFDTSVLPGAQSFGFQGAAFDGRYVYLVPSREAVVTRYDTQAGDFFSSGNWSTLDLSPTLGPDASAATGHFSTAGFDGRYVYFVPSFPGFGLLVRYDTFSTWGSPCSLSTYNLPTGLNNALLQDFSSAVFDGQYLYFVPAGSVVARFDTRSLPGTLPLPAFHGSFY